MTKKEKVVDLKPNKLNEDELNELQATIRTMDKLTDDVGRIEIQKYALLKAMEKTQENIVKLRKEFNEKYGTDNINIQTGEIAHPDTETKPEENGEVNKKD
tara:strand:- start:736 stop:1038 length:303 start_codon:yes stop_codon:yes gene_type:complete